ncbi:MAG: hypothetical protein H0T42_17815 [Deltaproteobacteria bacterium]|nr:hypothetical protein [Deltaproteobacteria bacterium]
MRFTWVAVVVVAGCAAQGTKATGNRSGAGAAMNSASPYSPDVRLWLEASEIGVDCPMGIAEARTTRVATTHWRTESDHLLAQVACMCDVADRDGVISYDVSCGYKPMPLAYKEPQSKDERRMRAWENRLVGQLRTGVTPDKLSRSVPFAVQMKEVRAQVAKSGDLVSKRLREVERAVARMHADAEAKAACVLEDDLASVQLALENHERIDFDGLQSTPGRALLAEAELILKTNAAPIKACKKLEKNREYQQLDAQLKTAQRDLEVTRANLRYTRADADCSSSRDESPTCRMAMRIQQIEEQMRRFERYYGVSN